MEIEQVIEIIENNGGEMEHEDLKAAIFQAGKLPDNGTFMRILQSNKIKRVAFKREDGTHSVRYSKAGE